MKRVCSQDVKNQLLQQ